MTTGCLDIANIFPSSGAANGRPRTVRFYSGCGEHADMNHFVVPTKLTARFLRAALASQTWPPVETSHPAPGSKYPALSPSAERCHPSYPNSTGASLQATSQTSHAPSHGHAYPAVVELPAPLRLTSGRQPQCVLPTTRKPFGGG